ncbi:transmembrane protein 244-like isoform X3 [Poeciliopsis prolifica]|uniref:transmembrane protein 244-like isoform X3 n=1 Tax=Poeciliopsis prolifica TaxID=188132 RepID=UPI0024137503|nr:transmembrane protein 244-like isoform X3 [Poeciliopsis prolifica]
MKWHSKATRWIRRLDQFDGLIPFDFKTEPAESNSKYLVNLLSLELTYFCSGILFAAVVKRRVWDYALTVTLLHVMITSLVMLEFPTVWQWWLALGKQTSMAARLFVINSEFIHDSCSVLLFPQLAACF